MKSRFVILLREGAVLSNGSPPNWRKQYADVPGGGAWLRPHPRVLSLVSAALSAKMRPAAQSPASGGDLRTSQPPTTIHSKSAWLWVIHYTSVPVFTR